MSMMAVSLRTKMHTFSWYPTTKTPTSLSSSSSCKVLGGSSSNHDSRGRKIMIYEQQQGNKSITAVLNNNNTNNNEKEESELNLAQGSPVSKHESVHDKWIIDSTHGVTPSAFDLNKKGGSNLRMLEGRNFPQHYDSYRQCIVESAIFAIDQHNKQHNTNYQLARVVAARSLLHRGPVFVTVLELKLDNGMYDLYYLEFHYFVTSRKINTFEPLNACQREALPWMLSDSKDLNAVSYTHDSQFDYTNWSVEAKLRFYENLPPVVNYEWTIGSDHGITRSGFELNEKAGTNLRMLQGHNYPQHDDNDRQCIVGSAIFAIDQHNKQHNTNYQLARVVAARCLLHRGPMFVIVLELKKDNEMCDLYYLELYCYGNVTAREIFKFEPLNDCQREALHWMISDANDLN